MIKYTSKILIITFLFTLLTILSCSDKRSYYDQSGYNYEEDMHEEQGYYDEDSICKWKEEE